MTPAMTIREDRVHSDDAPSGSFLNTRPWTALILLRFVTARRQNCPVTDGFELFYPDFLRSVLPALWPLAVFLPVMLALRVVADRVERAARQRRLGTLEERLERAGAGMRQARELVDGVEAKLTARQAALIRLTEQAADEPASVPRGSGGRRLSS